MITNTDHFTKKAKSDPTAGATHATTRHIDIAKPQVIFARHVTSMGEDIRAFASSKHADAMAWRDKIASESWMREFIDEPKPEFDIGRIYFSRLQDKDTDERFDIDQLEVE